MTTMPDLSSTVAPYAPPVIDAAQARTTRASVSTPDTVEAIRPEPLAAAATVESQRLSAERYELETQTQTSEGVVEALKETRRGLAPQLADMRRLYSQDRSSSSTSSSPTATEVANEVAEEKAEAAASLASRTRAAAARMAALRIAVQTQASREASAARQDAEDLAAVNAEMTSQPSMPEGRRLDLVKRQRVLTDSLAGRIGAVAEPRADGTVDATVGGRSLVRGTEVTPIGVSEMLDPTRLAAADGTASPGGAAGTTPSGGSTPVGDAPRGGAGAATSDGAGAAASDGVVPAPSTATGPAPQRSDVPTSATPQQPVPSSTGPTAAPSGTGTESGSMPEVRTDPAREGAATSVASGVTQVAGNPGGRPSTGTAVADPAPLPDAPASPSVPADPAATSGPSAGAAALDPTGRAGATTPAGLVPPTPSGVSDAAIAATWPDGTPADVGGRLGGLVQADRTVITPALQAVDAAAVATAGFVNAAQSAGVTADGVPGSPLLEGTSALTLSVVDGAAPTVSAAGGIPGADDPASPESLLGAAESEAGRQTLALTRRAGVVAGFDDALGETSARLGQHVSAALGAVGPAPEGHVVAALQQANTAMAFAGSVAGKAVVDGIPVLVGSSDPSVATASGTLPLGAAVDPVLRVEVLGVAAPTPGVPTTTVPGAPNALPGDAPTPAGAVAPTGLPGAQIPVGAAASTPGTPGGLGTAGAPGTGGPTGTAPATAVDGVLAGGMVGDSAVGGPDGSPIGGPAGPAAGATSDPVVAATGGAPTAATMGAPAAATVGGPAAATAGGSAVATMGGSAAVAGGASAPAGWSSAVVGDRLISSPTTTLTGVLPGIDVQVRAPGAVTLSVTADPGPALDRVQGLVDAVGRVAQAAGGAAGTAAGTANAAATPLGALKGAVSSVWSSLSSFASATPATPASGSLPGGASDVLAAVAAPLAAEVTLAFVGPDGRPVIPGTSVQRGRVSLDREVFAREYVKDAPSVEAQIASVARQVSSTADAATDPRIGALAVRIAAEQRLDVEYTLEGAGGQERLDGREDQLDRRAEALQSLLARLSDQSSWLGSQLKA